MASRRPVVTIAEARRLYLGGRVSHGVASYLVALEAVRRTPPMVAAVLLFVVGLLALLVVSLVLAFWPWLVALLVLVLAGRAGRAFVRRRRQHFEANAALGEGPTDWREWMDWKGKNQ